MAAVEVTISGVLYDKYARTTRPVVLIGEASLTGVGVGGGPMPPGPGNPPGTWGGAGEPFPTPPIAFPPGWVGGVPPTEPPVSVPPPGSPPVIMPGARPTHPIVAPAAIIVDYPGIGNVLVPKPLPA